MRNKLPAVPTYTREQYGWNDREDYSDFSVDQKRVDYLASRLRENKQPRDFSWIISVVLLAVILAACSLGEFILRAI